MTIKYCHICNDPCDGMKLLWCNGPRRDCMSKLTKEQQKDFFASQAVPRLSPRDPSNWIGLGHAFIRDHVGVIPSHAYTVLKTSDCAWLKPGMKVKRVNGNGGQSGMLPVGTVAEITSVQPDSLSVKTPKGEIVYGLYPYRFAYVGDGEVMAAAPVAKMKVYPCCKKCGRELLPEDAWLRERNSPNIGACKPCWIWHD